MADNASVDKLAFDQEALGSADLVTSYTSSKEGNSHDRFVTSTMNDQTTESVAYPLSNPRKYTLLALFASALAIDGKQLCVDIDRADSQSFVVQGSSFSREL
jgi:hypothetical protein